MIARRRIGPGNVSCRRGGDQVCHVPRVPPGRSEMTCRAAGGAIQVAWRPEPPASPDRRDKLFGGCQAIGRALRVVLAVLLSYCQKLARLLGL